MPKISIIVTAYNNEKYLKKCLDSLLAQTFKDIEIIIVDDASMDDSPKIIKQYAKEHQRVRAILKQKNADVSAARNSGLKIAKSDYIMFCDADDYYSPEMCLEMINAIQESRVDIATCRIKVHYEAHSEMKKSDASYYSHKYKNIQLMSPDVIRSIDSSVDNKIFKREILDKYQIRFPENISIGEDAFFVLSYLFCSQNIYFSDKELYHYIRHSRSRMSTSWKKNAKLALNHIEMFILLHDFLSKNQLLAKNNRYEFFWSYFREYITAAHRWCPNLSTRKEIRGRIKNFLVDNNAEISNFVSKKTQKKLKYQSSVFYYSPIWRLLNNIKHAIIKP